MKDILSQPQFEEQFPFLGTLTFKDLRCPCCNRYRDLGVNSREILIRLDTILGQLQAPYQIIEHYYCQDHKKLIKSEKKIKTQLSYYQAKGFLLSLDCMNSQKRVEFLLLVAEYFGRIFIFQNKTLTLYMDDSSFKNHPYPHYQIHQQYPSPLVLDFENHLQPFLKTFKNLTLNHKTNKKEKIPVSM